MVTLDEKTLDIVSQRLSSMSKEEQMHLTRKTMGIEDADLMYFGAGVDLLGFDLVTKRDNILAKEIRKHTAYEPFLPMYHASQFVSAIASSDYSPGQEGIEWGDLDDHYKTVLAHSLWQSDAVPLEHAKLSLFGLINTNTTGTYAEIVSRILGGDNAYFIVSDQPDGLYSHPVLRHIFDAYDDHILRTHHTAQTQKSMIQQGHFPPYSTIARRIAENVPVSQSITSADLIDLTKEHQSYPFIDEKDDRTIVDVLYEGRINPTAVIYVHLQHPHMPITVRGPDPNSINTYFRAHNIPIEHVR